LHQYTNGKHKAGQATSTIFQVFGMTQPGVNPSLTAFVANAHTTVPVKELRPTVD